MDKETMCSECDYKHTHEGSGCYMFSDRSVCEGPRNGTCFPTGNPMYEYAKHIAINLWEKHYRAVSPEWKPCNNLLAVLTQIDNMITGLQPTEKLTGILEGLECQNIDELKEESPEHLRRVGMEIAKHAKVGAFHENFVTSLMKDHFGAKQDVKEQRHGNISTKDRG